MTANRQPGPGVVLGGTLILIGVAVIAVRYLNVFAGESVWPLFIIGPGLLMIVLGLFLPNSGLLIGGFVVATIGLILAWQNQTGLWATWAWIWTLIPIAAGIGSFVGGWRTGDRDMRSSGVWQIVIGLAMLAAFYVFFEEVLGLSGGLIPLPEWAMPAVLIVLGLLVLARGLFGPSDAPGAPEKPGPEASGPETSET